MLLLVQLVEQLLIQVQLDLLELVELVMLEQQHLLEHYNYIVVLDL